MSLCQKLLQMEEPVCLGSPWLWEEPFGKVVGRKCLAARMLEAALGWRDSGLQHRWLVGQITIWWAECCPPCFTDREEQVPVGERNSPGQDLTDTIDSPLCSKDSMESCKSPVPFWKSGRSQYLLHCHHVESKSIHLKQNHGLPRIAQGVLWVGGWLLQFLHPRSKASSHIFGQMTLRRSPNLVDYTHHTVCGCCVCPYIVKRWPGWLFVHLCQVFSNYKNMAEDRAIYTVLMSDTQKKSFLPHVWQRVEKIQKAISLIMAFLFRKSIN